MDLIAWQTRSYMLRAQHKAEFAPSFEREHLLA